MRWGDPASRTAFATAGAIGLSGCAAWLDAPLLAVLGAALLLGLPQFRSCLRHFLTLLKRPEMFCHRIQSFCGLLLLLSGFRQFLLLCILRSVSGLLQFLIHAFGWWLNQGQAVVAVPRSFPLLFIGQILLFSIFHKSLQQIFNLLIHLLLLLLQFCHLLWLLLWVLFGRISGLQGLFFERTDLFGRPLCQL